MNREEITDAARIFTLTSDYNLIHYGDQASPSKPGTRIFDEPIFSIGDPDDSLFALMKDPLIIGSHYLPPREWMAGVQCVISFFLPFTGSVRKSNRMDFSWPSYEWLRGRIEGQEFINRLSRYLASMIEDAGYSSLVPSQDKRFQAFTDKDDEGILCFTSNWSERHAAYICGLGTFGLSKGLITEKGIAGRFGSVLTNLDLPRDERKYTDVYEYCSKCGACARNCPVRAISVDDGKNHRICSAFLDETSKKYSPRYGCGKCQVKVPCENGIPVKPRS